MMDICWIFDFVAAKVYINMPKFILTTHDACARTRNTNIWLLSPSCTFWKGTYKMSSSVYSDESPVESQVTVSDIS